MKTWLGWRNPQEHTVSRCFENVFFFGKFCRKIPVPESLFNEVSGPETYSFIEN